VQPNDPTMSVGFLSNQLARLMSNALAQSLQPMGLAPAQFATLLQLWREDGLTQRDLVDRLHIEQATMASTLNRMERDGLIVRKPHPQDSRAQSIFLTSRGRELQAAAMLEARQVSRNALAILGPDERTQLLELMHRVVEHMKSTRCKAP
jgi:DNA-binding MarR family transcriptional regulator